MDFAFSEEQEMLRSSAREFLTKEVPQSYVRKMMEAEDAWDEALWKKLGEMGWTGLGVPEAYGGVGTFLDPVVGPAEAGPPLPPAPFLRPMRPPRTPPLEAGS